MNPFKTNIQYQNLLWKTEPKILQHEYSEMTSFTYKNIYII